MEYDVALSFAGEDRTFVEQVEKHLTAAGVKVFYDRNEEVDLWGKDLYTHLDSIYRQRARYCVMFISQAYARKVWTNHERESAQARAFSENAEYILPARFDDTEIPGVRPTTGYIDLRNILLTWFFRSSNEHQRQRTPSQAKSIIGDRNGPCGLSILMMPRSNLWTGLCRS